MACAPGLADGEHIAYLAPAHRLATRLRPLEPDLYYFPGVGFYLRKSVRAGPFRFNLSKSGVGVSTGVKGLRVGAGPRGTYVHMGRGGLYYRQTLGGPGRGRGAHASQAQLADAAGSAVDGMSPVTLIDVKESPTSLVASELNAARRRRMNPFARLAGRHRVPIIYSVEGPAAMAYDEAVAAFNQVIGSDSVWLVDAAAAVAAGHQRKINAGANTVIKRQAVKRNLEGPKQLATNVLVPGLACPDFSVYPLPDQVVVQEGKRFLGWSYDELEVQAGTSRFIEDGRLPKDSVQVGQTWQYVNRDGGPDRRFKNNRRLPVMAYGQFQISGPGVRLVWQISNSGAAQELRGVLGSLADVVVALPRVEPEDEPVADAIDASEPEEASASPDAVCPADWAAPTLEPKSSPAAWLPDPTGEHSLRWWDGSQWTEHVT